MKNIYGNASRVVVSLGGEGQAQKALDFCKDIERSTAAVEAFTLMEGHEAEWNACTDLFLNRPWWLRTWIL